MSTEVWSFDGGPTTDSINVSASGRELVGIRHDQLASGTGILRLETTEDPPSVLDADATWDPVQPDDNRSTAIQVQVTDAEARMVQLTSNGPILLSLGRCRWHAYNEAGDAEVDQAQQTIKPRRRQL